MAGDTDVDEEPTETYFKCCRKVQCKVIICVNCGQAYHNSCAERYKLEVIDNTRAKCCNRQNITSTPHGMNNNLERENQILLDLVKEMKEKNTLL